MLALACLRCEHLLRAGSASGQNLLQQTCCPAELFACHDERRKQSNGVVAGADDQQPRIPAALDHRMRLLHDIETPHVSHSTDRADLSRASRDCAQSLAQPDAVVAHRCKQRRVGDTTYDFERYTRHERTAAECRAMIAGLYCRCDFTRDENRPHRQSSGERLRQRHHVWNDIEALVRKKSPETPQAALYLVEDERNPALSREPSELVQKRHLQHSHAALALNRLQDERGHSLTIESRVQDSEVALADADASGKRSKRSAIRWAVRCGERSEQAAMKAPPQ